MIYIVCKTPLQVWYSYIHLYAAFGINTHTHIIKIIMSILKLVGPYLDKDAARASTFVAQTQFHRPFFESGYVRLRCFMLTVPGVYSPNVAQAYKMAEKSSLAGQTLILRVWPARLERSDRNVHICNVY